jgi:flavin prenyltransferase
MSRFLICVTGASGSVYALRLLTALADADHELFVVASDWGERVCSHETGAALGEWLSRLGGKGVTRFACEDLFAPPASGGFPLDGTAVVPCSTATLGALASGNGRNLIHRAGEVALKEGRRLVLVPRESPLSLITLRNMATLKEAGATILPASPGFYHRPLTVEELVDQIVGRLLEALGAPDGRFPRWEGPGGGE